MRASYFLVARGAAFDKETNTASIWEVIEEIAALGFPHVFPQRTAVVCMEREAGDPDASRFEIEVTLAGKVIGHLQAELDFQGKPRYRIRANLAPVLFLTPGKLKFTAKADGAEVAKYEIDVNLVGEAKAVGDIVGGPIDGPGRDEAKGAPVK